MEGGDKGKVNAAVMDYLSMEIVHYVLRNSSGLHDEASFYTLEKIGFHTGQRMVERRAQGRTLQSHLEIIKFICTEIWVDVFGKSIDNLRTNHRGIYVLVDSHFEWLRNMSGPNVDEEAKKYVYLPSGIIRGALSVLGLQVTVSPDCSTFPECQFTIKVSPNQTA